MENETNPLAEGWIARWWDDYIATRDSLYGVAVCAILAWAGVVVGSIYSWLHDGTAVVWWDGDQIAKVGGGLAVALGVYFFFRTPWVQRNEARAEIARLKGQPKGAYISIGNFNSMLDRRFDPKTGARSGPVEGVDIRVADITLIAGKDPLAIKAHLEVQFGSESPTILPLKFITRPEGQGGIPNVRPEYAVPAGSENHPTMYCDVEDKENAEACLNRLRQSVKRVVGWDCLNPIRRATVEIPGEGWF